MRNGSGVHESGEWQLNPCCGRSRNNTAMVFAWDEAAGSTLLAGQPPALRSGDSRPGSFRDERKPPNELDDGCGRITMHKPGMYDNRIFVKCGYTKTVIATSARRRYDFCMVRKAQPKSVVSAWLNRGLEKPGKTNVGLAKAIGIDQPRISEMRNGKRRVQTSELRIIAEYLEEPIPDELIPAGAVVQQVPVVSWISAGRMTSSGDPDDVLGHIATAGLSPRGRWIALKVQGVSMDRISPPDSVIVVNTKDRDLVPQACYIIADSEGRASYKRYRPNPDRFEPVSTDTSQETIFPNADTQVIGRVRRSILDM